MHSGNAALKYGVTKPEESAKRPSCWPQLVQLIQNYVYLINDYHLHITLEGHTKRFANGKSEKLQFYKNSQ